MKINSRFIGLDHPTYFVADIAANHDGEISRAIDLIYQAAEAGADAVKFQNFKAETIVSDKGFRDLASLSSHQSEWKQSVYETYKKASISIEWSEQLRDASRQAGVDYFTAPYDLNIVEILDPFVCAWKIGSGDINWTQLIDKLSRMNKPLLIATGASTLKDVDNAMRVALANTNDVVLMQCNTNYTASLENIKYVNLNVLSLYADRYPGVILGLSDHTPGHSTVLGAITLGARVIEKHFTDDNARIGPDHKFSMCPTSWKDMVQRSRELEQSLGDGVKRVEANETETYVLQRRSLRANTDLSPGDKLSNKNVIALRPCPKGSLLPSDLHSVVGKEVTETIKKGDLIRFQNLEL